MNTQAKSRYVLPPGGLGTLSVPGRKGGQGKTTTAGETGAFLAYMLDFLLPAEDPATVVLIDNDSQKGALTFWYPPQWDDVPEGKRLTLADVLCDDADLDAATWPTGIARLSIVPSGPKSAAFEQMRLVRQDEILRTKIAESRIPAAARHIDCGPSLSAQALNGMVAGDRWTVVGRCGYLDVEGASELHETYATIKKRVNPDLEIAAAVITHAKDTLLLRHARDWFRSHYAGVPQAEIRDTVRVAEAPGFHVPVFRHEPGCTAAADYQALTAMLYPEVASAFEAAGGQAPGPGR